MLIDKTTLLLTILSALGSGMIAGIFYIFSVTIMRALERVAGGMAAMQSINVVILNPMFLGLFMGTAVLCVGLTILSLVRWEQPGATWILAGALLYLIGSFGITAVFNVPMNNALMAATPDNAETVWKDFLTNWTFWNHVRTAASVASSASFIAGLIAR